MSPAAAGQRRVPNRSCVACRTVRPKRELVRVVRSPDGRVVIDASGRVPGRGAYLCRDRACWTTALARGAIARALGVPLPPDVRDALEADLGSPERRAEADGSGLDLAAGAAAD